MPLGVTNPNFWRYNSALLVISMHCCHARREYYTHCVHGVRAVQVIPLGVGWSSTVLCGLDPAGCALPFGPWRMMLCFFPCTF